MPQRPCIASIHAYWSMYFKITTIRFWIIAQGTVGIQTKMNDKGSDGSKVLDLLRRDLLEALLPLERDLAKCLAFG